MSTTHRLQFTVGREGEQARLRELLDQAVAGHGSLVLVSGEAGIGKTTQVKDLAHRAASAGAPLAGTFAPSTEKSA